MKYFFYVTIIFLFTFTFSVVTAQEVSFFSIPKEVSIGQQFYVDVFLDSSTATINGFEGYVSYPQDKLSLVREEEGGSVVSLWIEHPHEKSPGTIIFSGIIPGGFNGVIDPFAPNIKNPGKVVRLVFTPKEQGFAEIIFSKGIVTLNDGKGTPRALLQKNALITIRSDVNNSVLESNDTNSPFLTASVIQDENLYNNKYVLIFQAIDKETGVASVELKEGNGEWKKIESPYLLEDQSRRSILEVRAVDVSGNTSVVTINPLYKDSFTDTYRIIPLALIVLVILLYVLRRSFKKKQ